MKKSLFIIIFVINAINITAQDIDFYHKNQNDKFKFEDINTQMSIDEYRILSRNLRMKEMIYASIVPGYIHFYAKDNKTGYYLLGIRTFAYAELAYMALKGKTIIGTNSYDLTDFEQGLTYAAFSFIIGTYLFDWIHGQYILRKKQENIRYKYNMKMNLSLSENQFNNKLVPTFSIQYRF